MLDFPGRSDPRKHTRRSARRSRIRLRVRPFHWLLFDGTKSIITAFSCGRQLCGAVGRLGGFPTPKTQRRRASYYYTQLMCPAPPVTGDGEIRSASREKQLTNFVDKVE